MVFVTGDLHGNFERFKPKYFPEQARRIKYFGLNQIGRAHV